jgi:hypothetical protein
MKRFERDGIELKYPARWWREDDETTSGWTSTLFLSETAFTIISLEPNAESPSQVVAEVLGTLRSDYKHLDAEDVVQSLAGQPALGQNIDFFSLDTANTCWTRAVETPSGILLILGQCSDLEFAQFEPDFQALLASLTLAGE